MNEVSKPLESHDIWFSWLAKEASYGCVCSGKAMIYWFVETVIVPKASYGCFTFDELDELQTEIGWVVTGQTYEQV